MPTHLPSTWKEEGMKNRGQKNDPVEREAGGTGLLVEALPTVKGLGRAESTPSANYPQARYNYE